jgi:hypothetical protein
MPTRPKVRRIRALAASLTLAIATVFAASGLVAAANPNQTFDVTVCKTPNGKNAFVTATWSGMQVDAYVFFVTSTDGSGGTFQPVPAPGESGSLTETLRGDLNNIQSVEISLFRATGGSKFREVASATITDPASSWPTC